jgi:type II secretory pathway component PulK
MNDEDVLMNRRSRGSLLVITLWLVAMVSLIAIAIARSLSLEVRLAKYRAAREQVLALARGGVSLALRRLADDAAQPEADGKFYDWPGDDWAWIPQETLEAGGTSWVVSCAGATDAGEARVRIQDEAGKLPLNTATKDQLVRLLADEPLAQAVVDARDEPDPAEDRPDDDPPYFAKNGPFAVPEELAELPGITPASLALLSAHASPYVEDADRVNLNTAEPDVLRALGLSESTVQLIVQFREGADGPVAHEQDGIFRDAGLAVVETLKDQQGVDLTATEDGNLLISNAFGVASETFRITAEGDPFRRPATKRPILVAAR